MGSNYHRVASALSSLHQRATDEFSHLKVRAGDSYDRLLIKSKISIAKIKNAVFHPATTGQIHETQVAIDILPVSNPYCKALYHNENPEISSSAQLLDRLNKDLDDLLVFFHGHHESDEAADFLLQLIHDSTDRKSVVVQADIMQKSLAWFATSHHAPLPRTLRTRIDFDTKEAFSGR